MMRLIKKGSTSRMLLIFIEDASKSDGTGLTGLVYNSAGLVAYYNRDNSSSATSITLATMTAGTWASGGFKEVDATNLPGWYHFGIPDAALASGATAVCVELKGATNMVPCTFVVQLCDEEPGLLASGAITAAVIASNAIDDDALAADLDVYTGKIELRRDAGNTRDEYVARWYKNGVRVTAGLTSVTIQVVKYEDGTDLIAATSMTQIGSTGAYKHNATGSARQTLGETYLVVCSATIDGSARVIEAWKGRDL